MPRADMLGIRTYVGKTVTLFERNWTHNACMFTNLPRPVNEIVGSIRFFP
jgi:hypothetical protein